jgi:hypothetical protein
MTTEILSVKIYQREIIYQWNESTVIYGKFIKR